MSKLGNREQTVDSRRWKVDSEHEVRFLTIGSLESRRVKFWKNALEQKGMQYQLLSYKKVIKGDFPKITSPTVLRITSPGEDFELKKRLLGFGGFPNSDQLVFDKGLIYTNQHWYKGWYIVLERIKGFIQQNPLLRPMNSPSAIQLAFHKLKCQQLLQSQGIQTPRIIVEEVNDYDTLAQFLFERKIPQVFIKPYHGSSASGVMALRLAFDKQVLYTTIDLKSNGLYNNLRLQKYTSRKEIRTIINAMVPSGLMVEKWIQKKRFNGKSVDFRILVINEKAEFVVPRMSKHFITNLHLGNEKGNIEEVEKEWSRGLIQKAKMEAIKAVRSIGGLFYAGVDVAISSKGKPYVLEVNAFGDLLIGIQKENFNTYEYELKELDSLF